MTDKRVCQRCGGPVVMIEGEPHCIAPAAPDERDAQIARLSGLIEKQIEELVEWRNRRDALKAAAWVLVHAQGRMLDKWAEGDDGVKQCLWRELHAAGDSLRALLAEDAP